MKYLAILFSLLFALNGPSLADTSEITEGIEEPEGAIEYVDTKGTILEIDENHILLSTETHGEVYVHLVEETLFEGEEPVVGAFVHVLNNGAMTMSIPPQIAALRVGCYAFTGVVSEIEEESFTLTTESSVYRVNAEAEKLAGLTDGQTVTVYSNGMMTMSIPAQIYGELIVAAE